MTLVALAKQLADQELITQEENNNRGISRVINEMVAVFKA